jgi:hypothetical protein
MARLTKGSARERLDRAEVAQLRASGTLITDERRNRPLYFDGRFLAARDLVRDQNYFLTRQADLGRAGGAGVVHGLLVTPDAQSPTTIHISAGHGITPAGELVILDEPATIRLADIPEIQRLDVAFGLQRIPRPPARNRTELAILALRAVEFSANPIASYPTAIDEERSVHDGDIVEGVAITLIPYPDQGDRAQIDLRRARAARDMFVAGSVRGFPVGALPLALIALEGGQVEWIDPFLVRREIGAEHSDILGLGVAPRALREAHLLQYDRHLDDVIAQRQRRNLPPRFAASEHFLALPPAGRLPTAAIEQGSFTQSFFPPEVDVELSFIPADEVQALLDESLLLPPIDLTLDGAALDSLAVLTLIPVTRQQFQQLRSTLSTIRRQLPSAAPGMLARRKPIEVLRGLRLPRLPAPILNEETMADAAWRDALVNTDTLIYVRRRNLAYKVEVTGYTITLTSDELNNERALNTRLKDAKLEPRVAKLRSITGTPTRAEIVELLGSPKFEASPTLLAAAVRELENNKTTVTADPATGATEERLDRLAVRKVAERFGDPRLGEGLLRLEQTNPALRDEAKVIQALADSGVAPELDRLGQIVPEANVAEVAETLLTAARSGKSDELSALVRTRLQEFRP